VDLQRQIDDLIREASDVFGWALAQLRAVLPAGLVGFGARTDAVIGAADSDGQTQFHAVRTSSLLGQKSRSTYENVSSSTAAIVTLAEADQFRQTLRVGLSTLRRGHTALKLRLKELSPIALDGAVFDYRIISPVTEAGAEIEVAIARRALVDGIGTNIAEQHSSWSVVGECDETGAESFKFASGSQSNSQGELSSVAPHLLLIVVILIAGLSWTNRLSSDVAQLETSRTATLVEARQTRDTRSAMEGVDTMVSMATPAVRLEDLLASIRDYSSALEAQTRVEGMSLLPDGTLAVEGYTLAEDGEIESSAVIVPIGDEF
jgi:hypothetical protein